MRYSYQCESCGEITEILCTIAEMKREIVCPICSNIAKKIIEAPALAGISSALNTERRKQAELAGKRMKHSHKSLKD